MNEEFMIVADNLQITNPVVARAAESQSEEPIRKIVRECIAAGANAIDINTGPLKKDPEKMAFFVNIVQDETDLPVLLDTTNPKAIDAGLSVCRNRAIINGVSLEPDRISKILPLVKKYQVDVIGYLLYPNSQVPPNGAERLNVALDLLSEFQRYDIDLNHLIVDPIVAPLMWENGNQQNMEILSVIQSLPDLFGQPVKTIAGLSNLTTGSGLRKNKLIYESVYASMLSAAGLDYFLVNVFHTKTLETILAAQNLKTPQIFSW